jgi:glycosyltransferase involved in cell wall biosynthesis
MLEAMACGTPVVTSTASCLPEVADDAAVCVPPTDVDALAQALVQAVSDEALRATLIIKGLARAQEFTWEKAARELIGRYRALLS